MYVIMDTMVFLLFYLIYLMFYKKYNFIVKAALPKFDMERLYEDKVKEHLAIQLVHHKLYYANW